MIDIKINKISFQKYIFPGGFLPNKNTINKLVSKNGLSVNSYISYADHYANTLAIWRDEFNKKWSLIKNQGFDLTLKECGNFISHIVKQVLNQKILT
jgi:cyclopropane-fatty-acyl-phospholipid synthase